MLWYRVQHVQSAIFLTMSRCSAMDVRLRTWLTVQLLSLLLQVAAWKEHKADCKRWRQQSTQQQQDGHQLQSTQQQDGHQEPLTAAAAARSSRAGSSSSSAASISRAHSSNSSAAASSSSSRNNGATARAARVVNRQLAAVAGGSSSRSRRSDDVIVLPDDALLPFLKYRTNADPRAGDIRDPVEFTDDDLAYLAEVWPGMLHNGDSCTINLDRYIMKKVGSHQNVYNALSPTQPDYC
jgi:hypothetical protein